MLIDMSERCDLGEILIVSLSLDRNLLCDSSVVLIVPSGILLLLGGNAGVA